MVRAHPTVPRTPLVLLLQQVIEQPDHFARSQIQRAIQMPIRMAALNLSTTGATKSRKAIPKDVRTEYKRLYGVSHEAILVVPAGTTTLSRPSENVSPLTQCR